MKILAIETSCDETAISYIEAKTRGKRTDIKILGNALYSQVKLHEKYGGVYPMMAKREHARVLTILLKKVLIEAKSLKDSRIKIQELRIKKMLQRETGLADELINFLKKTKKPKIDLIAVTNGPGLEPALWVGINFAKALSLAWNVPVIPINHMEGHIFSAFLQKKSEKKFTINNLQYPILSLLISGGHTELVIAKKIGSYKILGATRDDAVGEAFDKVARMLGLPYPGGPQISKLAEDLRQLGSPTPKLAEIKLPRPMINSNDFDFSFAGLKTAVLYLLKKLNTDGYLYDASYKYKTAIAKEFEDAATDVLITKTKKALLKTKAKTLILGGGVSANVHIRREFEKMVKNEFPKTKLLIPDKNLSTDNAIMIAVVAFFKKVKRGSQAIRAKGNLTL